VPHIISQSYEINNKKVKITLMSDPVRARKSYFHLFNFSLSFFFKNLINKKGIRGLLFDQIK